MNVSNFDELYPNRFLKAGLIQGTPTFTIQDVYLDVLKGDDEKDQKKGIVKFSDSEFELTLNKTNGICLREMFGKELKNWIGKRVTLCAEKAQFGKEKVDAVRVYGSPDIDRDLNAVIQLPRRKPVTRVLKCTRQTPAIDYKKIARETVASLSLDVFTQDEIDAIKGDINAAYSAKDWDLLIKICEEVKK